MCIRDRAKTKVQNLGSGHEAAPITVNGEVVEAVNSFVYLGSTISSGSNSHSEVMRRMGLASSVIDRLCRIWSQRHLSLTTKCRLYSSCILAVLLYACEMWTLTKSDWKRLEFFHLRCQRRILGIKWSDFITNAEVYTRSGLQSIQSIVHRRLCSDCGLSAGDALNCAQDRAVWRTYATASSASR